MGDGMTRRVHAEPVMGTVVSIDVRLPVGPITMAGAGGPTSHHPELTAAAVEAAILSAVAVLHRADDDFSTFKPASWVSRLRRDEIGVDDCPEHVREVRRIAAACRERTGGYFDPGWRGDGTLDPTGLVKGWAADAASAALTAAGITTHCVNAAGDLRASGPAAPGQPWRVGIADPFDRGRFVAVLECTDLAVATSGVSEQGQHVVNPRTGEPASGLASVTVVGPDLTLADAYATAGLAAGLEAWNLLADLGQNGWEWLTVEATGRLRSSPGLRQGPSAQRGVLKSTGWVR
jgi:thiamine biosynthesis lipoprotein